MLNVSIYTKCICISYSSTKKYSRCEDLNYRLPAVGKTTLKKLLCGQIISDKYNPTQGFDLGKVAIDGLRFNIWDFGGQKSYIMNQMSQYIAGSDIVLLVTDSTPQNVLTTKELLSYTKDLVEDGCEMIAIANKQDIKGAMEPGRVENVLQVPTFGMLPQKGPTGIK